MVPIPEPHYPYLAVGYCYLIVTIFLIHTSIRWYQGIYLSAKYWACCSGQLRPIPCYKDYWFFLIHTPKGWIQLHIFSNPISVSFRPLRTKCYSCKYESNERIDPTKTSSTPTKTQNMLQSLHLHLNTYS
jgi:hypothetical protein